MPVPSPDVRLPERPRAWKWWVCGLLLLATMVNYMDRLVLNQTSTLIMRDFGLGAYQYGLLESAFGVAFAFGAVVMGWLADRWNVRWLYPAALLVWSLAGFATGLVNGFLALLCCRFVLGLAEAGNWPCALRTTQRILPPEQRAMGNGILQSGAAVGAIVTPLIVLGLVRWTGTWRYSFMAVGAVGAMWVVGWLLSVRSRDLALSDVRPAPSLLPVMGWLIGLYALDVGAHVLFPPPSALPLLVKLGVTALGVAGVFVWLARVTAEPEDRGQRTEDRPPGFLSSVLRPLSSKRRDFFRRFWVLAALVVAINSTWHFFRAWLPLFLQQQHHYSWEASNGFMTAYYLATDLGSLTAGFATLRLARRGLAVHRSRVTVFTACAVLTTLSLPAALLPAGPLLLGLLLVIGFAALGLFPNYYSFAQELTVRHQGKLTGALGCVCWLSMSLLHEVVGKSVEAMGSYTVGVACAGFLPLLALAPLVLFWGRAEEAPELPSGWDGKAPLPHREAVRAVETSPLTAREAVSEGPLSPPSPASGARGRG
jgi:ACS family hexuronate transporter-like MFS transporter